MNRLSRVARLVALSLVCGSLAALTACSAGTDLVLPAPSPTSSPTPSPTGPDGLPIPAEDIPAWAAQAVPQPGDPGFAAGSSGWLATQAERGSTTFAQTLPAGDYTVTVACNGDSALTVSLFSAGEAPLAAQSIDCANATTRSFPLSTTTDGVYTMLAIDAEAVIYAVAFQTA